MPDPQRIRPGRDVLYVFAVGTAAAAALYQAGRFVPFVADNLQALIAAVFIYLPVWMGHRRKEDLSTYGFTFRPVVRSLGFALGTMAAIFPLFLVGFALFYRLACAGGIRALAPAALCAHFGGFAALARAHGPADPLANAFAQLVVVALPEELFFRGFLLQRLEQAFPPRRRWLGGGVGLALLASALLFALGHVLVDGDPRRLAVFFPGLLFAWLRSATGSIFAGTLVHAAANLYIESLHRTFFW